MKKLYQIGRKRQKTQITIKTIRFGRKEPDQSMKCKKKSIRPVIYLLSVQISHANGLILLVL